jgi:hypothetical protein
MHSSDTVRALGAALLPGRARVHGIAAAGAMLTCVAVVLNVGPFAEAQNNYGLRGSTSDQATTAIAERSNLSAARQWQLADGATWSAMDMEDALERTKTLLQPSLFLVNEIAPPAVQAAWPNEAGAEAEGRAARDTAGSLDPFSPSQAIPEVAKSGAIVGVWAPDADICSAKHFRDGSLPTVINADGASAGETFCMFTNRVQLESGWIVVAKCSNPHARWTSNVRLTVHENKLIWSSQRGTQTYARCAPDVLMAQAR